MNRFARSLLFVSLGLPFATGCGSSSGFEIKHIFDDEKLGQVPMEQLQPVLDAEAAIAKARLLVGQSSWSAVQADNEIAKAKNEQQQADLASQNADSDMDLAQRSSNQDRIAAAKKEKDIADAAKRAADAKLEYYTEEVTYEHANEEALRAEVQYDTALLELTKAKIADANKIRPDGFNLQDFQNQAGDAKQYYDEHSQGAKEEYQKIAQAQKEYENAKQAYEQVSGKAAEDSGLQAMPDTPTPPPQVQTGASSGQQIVVPMGQGGQPAQDTGQQSGSQSSQQGGQ